MPTSISSPISTSTAFQTPLPLELPPSEPSESNQAKRPRPEAPASPRDFGFGLLSRFCPPELVDRILDETGREEKRCRLLPARLVVYALLLMCLKPAIGYQKLMRHVGEAALQGSRWTVPNKSSFARARVRLGSEVMERLFRALARPLAEPGQAPCCFWRERRVMAIDGTTKELQDTPELERAFGGQTQQGKRVGLPQMRVLCLIEAGTRAVVDVAFGAYSKSEKDLATELIRSITPGTLILADRNFPGVKIWKRFVGAGADLVWRAKSTDASRIVKTLSDGTYLALFGSGKGAITLRVIEYTVADSDEVYRLLTNMLDPDAAPAHELARLYAERWESETSYKEIKVLQFFGLPLRSRTVDGVRQEFWANMIVSNINRRLAYQAALETEGRDPDRISFSEAQDVIVRSARRRTGLKAARLKAELWAAIAELTEPRALIARRDRRCPRIVRHRRSRFPSRALHDGPPSVRESRCPEIFICEPVAA